jgi:hypothetical protein
VHARLDLGDDAVLLAAQDEGAIAEAHGDALEAPPPALDLAAAGECGLELGRQDVDVRGDIGVVCAQRGGGEVDVHVSG